MLILALSTFALLVLACVGLQIWLSRSHQPVPVGNNPTFLHFQTLYFVPYFLALFADWLQGPYLYKLYSHYGFQEDQIAILYVCGFASTVVFGTWAPIAADRFGRKKVCIFFTVIYSLACWFKLSRSYGILICGRLLGGVATSLLFSAFESWYIYEHIENHDFPKEWISVTFSRTTLANGVLAIIAGLVAEVLVGAFKFGPVAPFMLAIPCLWLSGIIVLAKWPENYSKHQGKFVKVCLTGMQSIITEPRIFLIGIIMSLFESVMYIFVFLWTPILDPAAPPLGVIFSTFMLCIMIGSTLFHLLQSHHIPSLHLLSGAIVMSLIGNIISVVATHPDHMNRELAFVAFLLIEISVGIYFPAMGFIRSRLVPESNRTSIINWFRVPLNLIACAVLMMLHNDSFRHGNRLIFVACTGLLSVAALSAFKFIAMVRDDEELKIENNSAQPNSQEPEACA